MWRSVRPPVCPPACPADSLSHFCPKKTVSVTIKKLLTTTVSPPDQDFREQMRESDSVLFTDGDYVIM